MKKIGHRPERQAAKTHGTVVEAHSSGPSRGACLARAEVEKCFGRRLSDTEWIKHQRTLIESVLMLARWDEEQQSRARFEGMDPNKAA